MITIGAYIDGSDPDVDEAKRLMPGINKLLKQDMNQKIDMASSVDGLKNALESKSESTQSGKVKPDKVKPGRVKA